MPWYVECALDGFLDVSHPYATRGAAQMRAVEMDRGLNLDPYLRLVSPLRCGPHKARWREMPPTVVTEE